VTKETKIGLLVGLAFIILFAIILSEKGPTHKGPDAPIFTVVDSAKTAGPPTTPGQPLRDAGRLPVDSQLSPIVSNTVKPLPAAPIREEQIAQAPAEEEPLEQLPESLAGLLKNQPDKFEPIKTASPRTESAGHGDSPTLGTSGAAPTLASATNSIRTGGKLTPQRAGAADQDEDDLGNANQDREPQRVAKADEKAAPALPIKNEHIVQLGESLGKIAAKYYGRSTPARVEAIFNSNRDTLANISSVRAGNKLKIPDLGEHTDQFEAAPDFVFSKIVSAKEKPPRDGQVRIPVPISEKPLVQAADKPGKSEKKTPITMASSKTEAVQEARYDWYEVRKGDTLSKIARRELGSEKSAREIYKLNKDKLSDKNNLKPGTKIRMPSKAALGGETAAALSSTGTDNSEP